MTTGSSVPRQDERAADGRPAVKPARPHFSSGPCAKRPGWSLDALSGALLGRSHRQPEVRARLAEVISRSRALAGLPDDWRLAIVPASDTGAIEMALWSLLGQRPVDVLAFDSFTRTWARDVTEQLRIEARVLSAPDGELPDLASVDFERDVVFAWNGTTSGVCVPDSQWIAAERTGLTICDATSAIFAMPLPWSRLDAVTWSWQKVLGGEAAHGMLALSPRAIERLITYRPARPLPKIFRMLDGERLNEALFEGRTINTPSMLCVEDALDGLRWAEHIGGLDELHRRCAENLRCVAEWVARTPWIEFLARDPATRSRTSMCLRFVAPPIASLDLPTHRAFVSALCATLEAEAVAFDIRSYPDAPPGLRIWGGATVERADIERLLPWIEWAFHDGLGRL